MIEGISQKYLRASGHLSFVFARFVSLGKGKNDVAFRTEHIWSWGITRGPWTCLETEGSIRLCISTGRTYLDQKNEVTFFLDLPYLLLGISVSTGICPILGRNLLI